MLLNTPEFKVGMLVVIISAVIAGLTLKVSKGPSAFSGQKEYWFELEDAGGLVPNSAVRMAGIKVGIIKDIKLRNGKAVIEIVVDDEVPMTDTSSVEIRALGILGDKSIELKPGDPATPQLEDGHQIMTAVDTGSLDKVVKEVGKIAANLSELGETLTKATTGSGDPSSPVGRIILNIEKVSKDLSEITGQNKEKVNDIIDRVSDITETLDEVINDEGENGFRSTWGRVNQALARVDRAVKNIEEVSDKINNGNGTIGRLINDEETIEKIHGTIDSVNEFLGGASDMETSVDYHAEYLSDASMTKSYIGFKIQPGLDRYYLLQVVDDPRGVAEVTETTSSVDDATPSVEDKTVVYKNKIKFTLLFAKNFYNFTARGGIMENSGGVGFDYYFLNRKVRLSFEAFNFDDVHLKTYLKYDIWKGIYLSAGMDDFANSDRSSPFIGAGLFLTNDDLKLLVSQLSFSGS